MRSSTHHPSARPGFALGLTLIFTLAIGALATSAIVLSSNATLMAKSVDRQRELKYASEAALEIGKSQLNFDPAALPDSGERQLLSNAVLTGADNRPLPNVKVNVWVGPSGSTTGQFGRFASIVAQAVDNRGTGFVRRLEVTQESFAKFAYWSNSETMNGTTIYFNSGDQLWGPVWSNDIIHIGSGGATFHDDVSTAKTISGLGYGRFIKGYHQNQKPITLPSTAALSKLSAYAALAGYNFTAPTSGNETTTLMRVEFVAADLNGDGDSLQANEGFFRVYQANTGQQAWLRGDWPGTTTASSYLTCGDWHPVTPGGPLKFFPAAVHNTTWFQSLMVAGGMTSTQASAEASATLGTIMAHAGARCFLGGDPHLVAVARTSALYPNAADRQKGGDDTTFTPVDAYGAWKLYSNSPDPSVSAVRADAKYLFPIYRGLNPNAKGVVYVNGTAGVSGVLRGRVTLYAANGDLVLLDDMRYADDPGLGICADILGLISDHDIVVADNALNSPEQVSTSSGSHHGGGSSFWGDFDDTPDFYLHGVLMALSTSFRVQNYDSGPSSALNCQGSVDGRGCLYLTGGIIQQSRGPVGLSSGQGYVKRYSYDRCAALNPPPYFPTTGRFTDNRFMELNPVGFDAAGLFRSLTPGGP
ncbi:MAG: hypothetical protein KGL93_03565 [Gemmatimonadota bacterium]|nr:hypothetical protein [Gemmatimonadota bacterium]